MADMVFAPGHVALVTGAAGGIGRATVRRFAEAGASVVLVDAVDGVHEVAAAFRAEFPDLAFTSTVCDVTDEQSVAAVTAHVESEHGRLDSLALVAGVIQEAAAVQELEPAAWRRVLDVNLTGPFLVSRALAPLLARDGGGAIASVASWWGRSGHAYFSAYCSSKAALIVLTQSLAAELAPHVRANTVCPGNINTAMHRNALDTEAAERGITFEEMKAIEWEKIPLGFAGEPSTIADAVVYLCSPAASYVTGASLDVNGGVLFH
ncbi:SDR family NAD(P)-dependent oxidoreductase [Streptomyces sp. NPDC055692]|uniref:SDR family NAD(P)-dependent oxidoreductase n=1 Tax=Streptomyces sp. NPDC055692 TaxID=3155683 RepID=UPI003449ECED